jgi:hypothetical protein
LRIPAHTPSSRSLGLTRLQIREHTHVDSAALDAWAAAGGQAARDRGNVPQACARRVATGVA